MKNPLSFAIILLIAAMLACNLPGSNEDEFIFSKVPTMAVNPSSGSEETFMAFRRLRQNRN